MKYFVVSICRIVGMICGIVYSPISILGKLFTFVRHGFFAGWYRCKFKSMGRDFVLWGNFSRLEGPEYISVGNDVTIGKYVRLTAWSKFMTHDGELQRFIPMIVIGNNCSIGDGGHVTAINKIIFGDNVRLGPKVLITDNAHGLSDADLLDIAPNKRPLYTKGPVIIDDNVWIAEKASIMAGVHIGKGSIVAANSVVTKDVPPYSVVAGVPAKVVKQLR